MEMPPEHEMTAVFEEFAAADGKGIVEWLGITSFASHRSPRPNASRAACSAATCGSCATPRTRERDVSHGLGDLVRNFNDTLDVRRGLRAVYAARAVSSGSDLP